VTEHGLGLSSTVDLGGPVHYLDYGLDDRGTDGGGVAAGGPDGAPTVVLVHGLGGSHLNWDLVAPLLTPHARVLALDLPGFGRSEPGDRRATVHANVAVLDRFLERVVGRPVVLVGNSMGGMISILAAARSPERVSGLVLLDAALPGPRRALDPRVAAVFGLYAVPFVGERFLWLRRVRQTPLTRVRNLLRLVGVDPDELPPSVVDRSVALLEDRDDVVGMDKAFLAAARSLLMVLADPRQYRAAMAGIEVPVLMLHGDRDRLVPVVAARDVADAQPAWRYVELAGVGHVPQLEAPQRVADEILGWLPAVAQASSQARSASTAE
jgi:pimeloyl-ACP methyl ester carboxylesterase